MAPDPENTPRPRRRVLAGEELEMAMAEIQVGSLLGGHVLDAETLERTRQILEGSLSYGEAMAELRADVANWRRENPGAAGV